MAARTINQIQTQILTEKDNQTALSGLTSRSQTSIYRLWSYITAVAIFIQEGLWDVFKSDLETTIANAPVGTDNWVQAQCLKFQYSVTTPQVITMPNFVPTYATVSPDLQIITRASVKTLVNKVVSVKVAKSDPPEALTSPELTAFQAYLNTISFAGVQYNAVSRIADKLLVGATIYYNGQYSASIQSDIELAVNNYLAQVPFDTYVKNSKLEDALQSVVGVEDVVLNDVAIRPDSVTFSSTTYLIQNNTEIYRQYGLYAGYAISETTAGHTLADTITYVAV